MLGRCEARGPENKQLRAENASLNSQLAKARAKLRRSNDSAQLALLSQQPSQEQSQEAAQKMDELQASVGGMAVPAMA